MTQPSANPPTPFLAAEFKVRDDLSFGKTLLPHLLAHMLAEYGEEFPFQCEGETFEPRCHVVTFVTMIARPPAIEEHGGMRY